jgi:hypothetical protein
MTDDPNLDTSRPEEQAGAASSSSSVVRLPGLAAIGLYMLFLAGTVILGVVLKYFPPLYLVFPVLFIAAGLGLLMLFRWAWALTLAAVLLLMAMFLYQFSKTHAGSSLVQGALNLVFFLYLVRAEVRERLR